MYRQRKNGNDLLIIGNLRNDTVVVSHLALDTDIDMDMDMEMDDHIVVVVKIFNDSDMVGILYWIQICD